MSPAPVTKTARKGNWFLSASGVQFYPLDPRVEDIRLYDIAHALANVCRFGGHCRTFYSVAEHSLHVARLLERWGESPHVIMCGLLHDASEAYIGDMVRPLKLSMPDYRIAESNLMVAIARKFNITVAMPPIVKKADDVALMTERRDLVISTPYVWSVQEQPDEHTIFPLGPGEARQHFMQRFYALDTYRRSA